jgi:hypothetical protein|tara:strand:- start:245 stop:421 length:177 start_codon:yes stop_codon:yes gene_type:complete
MNKEQMIHLIKLVKNNADNNLILLKALIELKTKVEKLERTEETFATDWIDEERGQDVV